MAELSRDPYQLTYRTAADQMSKQFLFQNFSLFVFRLISATSWKSFSVTLEDKKRQTLVYRCINLQLSLEGLGTDISSKTVQQRQITCSSYRNKVTIKNSLWHHRCTHRVIRTADKHPVFSPTSCLSTVVNLLKLLSECWYYTGRDVRPEQPSPAQQEAQCRRQAASGEPSTN